MFRRTAFAVAFSSVIFAHASAQEKTTPKTQAGTATPIAPAQRPAGQPSAIEAYPTKIVFTGSRDEQRIGVLGTFPGAVGWELTREAAFVSANPKIATVDARGVVRPVGDGKTTITVNVAGQSRSLPVSVIGATADTAMDFTREITPILTRAGCNMGSCHGAQHGRGGFKLSLLGFDPIFDYQQIVQSAEGRRVVVSNPAASILLQKPTLQMEHGGGERLKPGSREYALIERWLADGAPEPTVRETDVEKIEVWPARRILTPGESQQVLVRATWKGGRVEDVTGLAQFDSLNDAVASVTPAGMITAKNRGETHVMVRFCGQATVVQVTLPYSKLDRPLEFASANFIDEKLAAKWKDLGLTPAKLCNDADFFRRIHLDAIGTLPKPEEIQAFLADPDPKKRQNAVERVLDRPEFIDFWALKWGDLLKINRADLQDRGMWSFHNWVRASLRDRKPIDEMVRDIITAEGSTFTEGPANYFMTSRTPQDWAETTSQVFLGVRIGCAKCHHHPFEKWSQDDYSGMAAFFARLGLKNSQEFGLFGREQVVYLKSAGEVSHPRRGGVVKPRPLDGDNVDDPLDRRVKLADWLTSNKNPFFARNIANRFWGYLMGRGLVEPLDDMRATNPASNPELLDALADELVRGKFDLRHLMRTIMNSRAYQLDGKSTPGNQADATNVYYSRYFVRRLTAEQLADAVDFATGTQEKYAGLPLGTRAIQLPDPGVKSYLLDVFGRAARQVTCECERTGQPNIAQALHLLNGDFLTNKLESRTGRIEKLVTSKTDLKKAIDELYLATVSRPPTTDETVRAEGWIRQARSQREGLQDVLWVLVNSREFLFNH